MVAVGVDACRGGWVAVCLARGRPPWGLVVERLDELVERVPEVAGVAIDIPIGLPADGRRAADLEARALLGPRRNSVFATPVRAALEAPTHAEATAVARARTGQGVSQQAYALAPKILEADRWRRQARVPVWEVHPEVSFALLLGRPAAAPKRTWAGFHERLEVLRTAGIPLDGLGTAGVRAGADDVLDAAAAAWSARRLLAGEGVSLPEPPETDPDTGGPMAIWA